MNSYSIIKHGKAVLTFKAKDEPAAKKFAFKRFPGWKAIVLRDNGPVLKIQTAVDIPIPAGWDVAETAVTPDEPECGYCGRPTSQCDHPSFKEVEDDGHIPQDQFCPDCGHLIECCTCYDSGDKAITHEIKPIPRYTRKLTKAQVRAEIKQKGWRGIVVACKMNPNSPWVSRYPLTFTSVEEFDKFVNNFEVYNCTKETGKYAAYYSAN